MRLFVSQGAILHCRHDTSTRDRRWSAISALETFRFGSRTWPSGLLVSYERPALAAANHPNCPSVPAPLHHAWPVSVGREPRAFDLALRVRLHRLNLGILNKVAAGGNTIFHNNSHQRARNEREGGKKPPLPRNCVRHVVWPCGHCESGKTAPPARGEGLVASQETGF